MSNSQCSYNTAQYLLSVNELAQLPKDKGGEVAFIGRSNSGKSSAINTITGIKGLARTSKTPGRTQMINYFELKSGRYLVDLPGYGYAKVPMSVKERWQQVINGYLQSRKALKGLVLMMDVRHPFKELDQQMLSWAISCRLRVHILLTKSDKLKRGPAINVLQQVEESIAEYKDLVSVSLFSSLSRTGVGDIHQKLDQWMESK